MRRLGARRVPGFASAILIRVSGLNSIIRQAIADTWGIPRPKVVPHHLGMNSGTWMVSHGEHRWIAKSVPAARHRRFVGGLECAAIVDDAGIPAGRPEPTSDGRPWASVEGQTLALLRFVAGDPLTGTAGGEQELIGSTLARAHRALRDARVADAETFHWLDADASHLDVEPWARSAVRDAIIGYDALPPNSLAWGLLHSDPAPEAFLFDRRGDRCGLIDWDFGLRGPLMYDVASAVMYVGGPSRASALLDGYLGEGVMHATEVERSLATMLRLRWAVQADYFSRRIAADDLTGIAGPAENRRGLDDARRALMASRED